MKPFLSIVLILFSLYTASCKKSSEVKATLRDTGMNTAISNVEVHFVEYTYQTNLWGSKWNPKYLQTKTTDSKGEVVFEKQKMKHNSDYRYAVICPKTAGIEKDVEVSINKSNKNQEVQLNVLNHGSIRITFTNLFNPGITGDYVTIIPLPNNTYNLNYNNNSGIPSDYNIYIPDVQTGKRNITVIKNKLGIESTTIETILVNYNQTATLAINW